MRKNSLFGAPAARIALLGLAVVAGAASCALPWRDYPVSPSIVGRLEAPLAGASLEFTVLSSTGWLGARREIPIASDGSFAIDRIALRVAGHEYDQRYRAFLNYRRPDGTRRTIWRAEWFRGDTSLPVTLDCDVARSTAQGQPCLIENPTQHHWLVQLGQIEFLESCSGCHGVGAVGQGIAAEGLTPPPPDLTRIAARRFGVFNRAAILQWIDGRDRAIAHGSSAMPVWGDRLTRKFREYAHPEDIAAARLDAVVTYLESVQRPADDEG